MATTAEKLREMRKNVHGNFDKIMRKYYDDVNAQELGAPLPYAVQMGRDDAVSVVRRRSKRDDSVHAEKAAS